MPTFHLKTNYPLPFTSGYALQPNEFVKVLTHWERGDVMRIVGEFDGTAPSIDSRGTGHYIFDVM